MGGDAGLKKLAKAAKERGLKKLKFYCQMCNKQCRDENGFRNHQRSEGHLRQMALFAEDSEGMIEKFSRQFERTYLANLKLRHGTKRVRANTVYQEIITDRHHVHMNSTKWATLGEFVADMAQEGKVVVDEDPKGLHVTLIDRSPEALAREQRAQRGGGLSAEEERERELRRRRAALRRVEEEAQARVSASSMTPLARGETVQVSLAAGQKRKRSAMQGASLFRDDGAAGEEPAAESGEAGTALAEARQRALEAARRLGGGGQAAAAPAGAAAERQARGWLVKGVVVKVRDRELAGGAFYKTKAKVHRVEEAGHVAILKVDAGDGKKRKLRIDAAKLETVIPKEGGAVMVLPTAPDRWAAARDCAATLLRIRADDFVVDVLMLEGDLAGTEVTGLEYEMVSKLDI